MKTKTRVISPGAQIIHADRPADLLKTVSRRLRVVVVDRFYDRLDHPEVQSFFGKLAHFKIQAYRKDYPYGVLPFGSHDFAGTHFALCEELPDGRIEPIMAIKAISLDDCREFNLPFPGLELPREAGAIEALAAIEERIQRAERAGKGVGYLGSWAMRADLRGDKLLSKVGTWFMGAMLQHWFLDRQIGEIVTFGVPRFKVERFHKYLGLEPLALSEGREAKFEVKSFFDEPVFVSVAKPVFPGPDTTAAAAETADYWRNRIELGVRPAAKARKAA